MLLISFGLSADTSGISKGYFAGTINCTNSISGGITSGGAGEVTNCFWDTQVSGKSMSIGGTGKTTAEMTNASTTDNIYLLAGWSFKGLDANPVWNIGNSHNNGYPYLNWEYPDDNATLPVTLSSFSAVCTASNTVSINWTTESESNVRGYHLLRNDNNQFANALRVTSSLITANNTSNANHYSYTDLETQPDTGYYYWLQSIENDGSVDFYGPLYVKTNTEESTPELPQQTSLANAYPNPFRVNHIANFDVSVKDSETASLKIFNAKGQLVKEFSDIRPSVHNLSWNGKDMKNKSCASGIYFYQLSSQGFHSVKKLVIIK
jgi:hypothetical protein